MKIDGRTRGVFVVNRWNFHNNGLMQLLQFVIPYWDRRKRNAANDN